MITGIIGLLSIVLAFGVWLFKRNAAKEDAPETKHENAISDADAAIAGGSNGVVHVNLQVEKAIERAGGGGVAGTGLHHDQAGGDPSGPGNPVRLPGIDELNRRLPGASGPDA